MTGKELKDYREGIDLTQEQLAEALQVASNTVSRWERDDRAIPPYLELALKTIGREKLVEYVKSTSEDELLKNILFDFNSIVAWEGWLETHLTNNFFLIETVLDSIRLEKEGIKINDNLALRKEALHQFKIILGLNESIKTNSKHIKKADHRN